MVCAKTRSTRVLQTGELVNPSFVLVRGGKDTGKILLSSGRLTLDFVTVNIFYVTRKGKKPRAPPDHVSNFVILLCLTVTNVLLTLRSSLTLCLFRCTDDKFITNISKWISAATRFYNIAERIGKYLRRTSLISPINMTKTFTLNDGSKVPWLAFGTGTALYKQDATDLVRTAIENNITHLDGAQVYNNEDTLGAGIKASGKSRSELFVVTKIDSLQAGQTVKDSLKVSLAKLGLDYVDLFLIHSPYQIEAKKEKNLSQWWEGMEEVKKAGLAKSIGVSNFYVEELEVILKTAKVVPSVNQVGPSFQFISMN